MPEQMTLRHAAEMALGALEQTPTANKLFDESSYEAQKEAIEALRQALAQPDEVLAEREACAKLCDDLAEVHEQKNQWGSHKTADALAQAIRARGEK